MLILTILQAHSYHSYVDLLVDTNSGLIGPTIIYGSGKMNSTMAQYREIPLLYMGYNEAMSVLSGENSKALLMNHTAGMSSFGSTNQTFGSGNSSVWHPQIVNLGLSGRFSGAPQFFTLNGYFFANNPTFEMCLGDKVIWYAYAYGAEPHVFHLHGHSVQYHGSNEYSISLGVGEGKALYMNATVPGLWQVICHVNDHHQMGMVGNYRIYNGDCPLSPLEKA
jgi:FtsP/CotA-like multicopper oxidase with cupredoxin domain